MKKDLKIVKFYSILFWSCEILSNFVLYSVRIGENFVQILILQCSK
jgi:hypothetical protein